MQKRKSIILAAVVLAVLLVGAVGVFFLTNRPEPVVERKLTDIEWYSEDTKEFVITTAQELYDLIELSKYYDFSGQTIKLGADIVVNEGNAADWAEKAPKVKWFPIDGFAGKFDGQGHTISGIYGRGVDTAMGLFSNTKTSCGIKNFKLLNSYFEVDGLYSVGSIVSNGCGTLEKLYSDAIVTSNGENAGGIIGCANADGTVSATAKNTKVTNCWFDGQVKLTTKTGRYGGGIAGRVAGGTLNISHCLNAGTISSESKETNGLYVGGIFGALTYTNYSGAVVLDDSLNVGKIEVNKSTATGSIAGGTIGSTTWKITNTFTTEQSYTEVCSYQKGSTEGGVPMLNTDFIVGEEWYSWTTLDYDTYWTVTKDSTPILKCFADEVIDTSGLAKAYSFDWYDEYGYELVIKTKEELYGFALMSYSTNFEGKIVTLGNDIIVNEGKATDWAKGKNIPENCWIPIGRTPAFQGNFDGKGYTISGLYGTTASPFMGLFGWAGNFCEIKNVSLTNSFFELTSTSASALGSIAGRLEGKIDTIYTDAIINTVGVNVGGLVGYKLTDIESKMTNCWYNGTINMIGDSSKNVGGFMGRLIKGTITVDNCLFSGTINMGGKKRTINTGGFIGNIAAGTVTIKGSLNSGELITTEAEKVNASGRVFGQVADSDTITITFENAYVTDKGGTYFWYCAGKKPVVIGGAELKEEKYVLGYNAYSTTGLDFAKYWSVVVNKDGTPILKSFAKKSPSVAGLTKTFDKSWYDHNKTTYVLKDAQDLYGFLYLSNSKIDFAGKTITLANDIVVNAGTAAEWAEGKNLPGEVYNWGAIGKYTNFQGTFDGQGHTISGLYGNADTAFLGLFGWVGVDGTVKNVSITNTYFESTAEGSAAVGSIAGRLEGDIHTTYSDAIIKSAAGLNGGIAGYKLVNTDASSITNSWYAGKIILGEKAGYTGGIIGRIIKGDMTLDNCLFSGTIEIGGQKRNVKTGGFIGDIANGNTLVKGCLNSGKFILTEAEKVNTCGRVFGSVVDTEDVTVTITDTYFTTEGYSSNYHYYCAGSKPTIKGGAEAKAVEDILGYDGYRTTSLDFDNYWAVVVNADGTPILKSFASTVPSVAGLTKTFDKSWYDAEATTYVLNDKEDLYGLLYLSNSKINFKGKTITLGNDIVVNSGSAAEWAAGTTTPENVLPPIGKNTAFEGTFDGKGKTISGIYQVEDTSFAGLFGWTGTSSEIKNLRLTNSYFESTETGSAAIGSIAGRCEGNITGVYSDAIITSAGALNGGIAGYRNSNATGTISNCWFDGTINMVGDKSKMTGGIMGRIIKGELVVDNCLFSGTIHVGGKKRSSSTGGFVGGVIYGLTLKNSLNTGEFKLTDAEQMNSLGRVIGQIESSENTDVTVEHVYFTNKGVSATYKWYRPTKEDGSKEYLSKLEGTATQVAESNLLGEYGYHSTELDFEKYWTTVLDNEATLDTDESGTPILRSFASVVNPIPTAPSYADVSWYENGEPYVIYDSADLFGLAYLSKTGVTFEGKTITIADTVDKIAVNTTGTAAEWAAGTAIPEYEWEAIGWRVAFQGTFDGNGKTISGLYGTTDTTYMGLFGYVGENGEIKNLRLENSSFTSRTTEEAYIGSIAGRLEGDMNTVYAADDVIVTSSGDGNGGLIGYKGASNLSTIENCWYAGTINMIGDGSRYTGGIIGRTQNGEIVLDNCLFSGTIHVGGKKRSSSTGGFAGMVSHKLTIKNSMNTGEYILTDDTGMNSLGRIIGQISNSNTTNVDFENVYYTNKGVSGTYKWYCAGKLPTIGTGFKQVEEGDVTGEYAYYYTKLDYENYWALIKGGTPVLKYFAGESLDVPNAPEGADISWLDTTKTVYTLSDKEDLYGFAYLSSLGLNFAGKTIELDKDITVNTGTVAEWEANSFANLTEWEPIGSTTNKFAGTFDGKNHSIKGIYINENTAGAALFRGTTAESTIKNLKLENSYIKTTAQFSGSFVGSASGNLTNLYSDAKIVSTKDFNGGIVGQTWTDAGNDIVISGCWFAGQISAPKNIGGILAIGSKGNVELINCLNTGNIAYTTDTSKPTLKWIGGLVGRTLRSSNEWSVTEDTSATMAFKMTNCLNLGELTDSKDKRVGSALGQNNGPSIKFTNVYTTNESYSYDGTPTSVGRNNSGSVVTYGGISLVAESDITVAGTVKATSVHSKLAGFDFKNTWAIGKESTPVLQWAADLGFDTTWYDETATTYTIGTAEELYGVSYLNSIGVDFAGKTINLDEDITVNEGTVAEWKDASFKDLETWTPIENFAGTFNGNNHSIKGIYVNFTELGAAFFKNTVAGSTIKNLKFENSYINSTKDIAGSVVASCGGNMENVYSSATVNTSGNYAGGLIGQIFSTGNVSIKNCWFAGDLDARSNGAGLVGLVSNGTIVIENCLNTGTVKTTYDSTGGFLGRTFTSGQEWTLSGSGTIDLTFKQCLNAGQISGRNSIGSAIGWHQKGTVKLESVYATETSTGASTSGVLIGAKHKNAIQTGDVTDVKLAEITVAGSVKEADVISKLNALDFAITWGIGANNTPELSWVNNLNTDIRWYDESKTSYTISTLKELNGLVALSTSGETFAGKTITLGADITVNEGTVSEWDAAGYANLKAWTPIGTLEQPFAGNFDGDGHTISGVYANTSTQGMGLFMATAEGSTIKNLKLTNSYLKSTYSGSYATIGSVVGRCGGNLENVYSNAIIKVNKNASGGIAGQVWSTGSVSIKQCWFAGSVISSAGHCGGIAGYLGSGTITMENCLNTGKVNYAGAFVGGLCGNHLPTTKDYVEDQNATLVLTIKNCLNTGKVKDSDGARVGSIIGNKNGKKTMTVENVYATNESYLNNGAGKAVGNGTLNSGSVTMISISDITVAGDVTADDVKATLSGFDFDTVWTIGTNGTPELQMKSSNATVSLFSRVVKAIVDFVTD